MNSKQSGFSIVELLVAGMLGLFLIAGVIQLFLGSNRNFTMQEELATIQENGRFALMFMERQVQQAGWVDDIMEPDPPLPIDIENSTDGTNDSIIINYTAAIDGVNNVDCNGAQVADGRITNTFFVDGNGNLMCQGNGAGAAAQPLLTGVERFQILYGVETELNCPDGVINNYLNRTDVNNSGLAEKIISVRVGILLRGETEVLIEDRSETFTILNVDHVSATDKLVRRLFQQTIFIPNAAYRAIGDPQQIIECMAASV